MFGKRSPQRAEQAERNSIRARVSVYLPAPLADSHALCDRIADAVVPLTSEVIPDPGRRLPASAAVFALFPEPEALTRLAEAVREQRAARGDGWPVLIVGLSPAQLTEFGGWLADAAPADLVHGLRLIVERDPERIVAQLAGRLEAVVEPNVIAMPVSTEVDNREYKYFYCLSPELRGLLAHLRELAENGISRIYLLGGPGSGKTSLAYYYFLARTRGNFVTVNLTAEATDDKAAMKSLLCGHVSGAFQGAGSRTGAFSHARDGVCFLDESHGVSGSVIEVLMEALDANQYLPYGASAKRPLECAMVFASNRSWETLIASLNMDERTRLGAMILHLPDLAVRREDLIAVLATTLDGMRRRATTWVAPAGLSQAAWQAIGDCPWRGNTRALIRVIETAFVTAASRRAPLIERDAVDEAMAIWEPETHASHALYTSGGR